MGKISYGLLKRQKLNNKKKNNGLLT